jgi:drug/metabolite transporter (DMT)-like permease
MWIIFSVLASIFWGLTYVFRGEVYKKISVFTSISLTSLFIFIAALIASIALGKFKKDLNTIFTSKEVAMYLVAAISVSLLGEVFIALSVAAKNPTLAGLVEISYPIFIAVFSYILYRQSVSLPTILGGVLIFFGIGVIYYFNR